MSNKANQHSTAGNSMSALTKEECDLYQEWKASTNGCCADGRPHAGYSKASPPVYICVDGKKKLACSLSDEPNIFYPTDGADMTPPTWEVKSIDQHIAAVAADAVKASLTDCLGDVFCLQDEKFELAVDSRYLRVIDNPDTASACKKILSLWNKPNFYARSRFSSPDDVTGTAAWLPTKMNTAALPGVTFAADGLSATTDRYICLEIDHWINWREHQGSGDAGPDADLDDSGNATGLIGMRFLVNGVPNGNLSRNSQVLEQQPISEGLLRKDSIDCYPAGTVFSWEAYIPEAIDPALPALEDWSQSINFKEWDGSQIGNPNL